MFFHSMMEESSRAYFEQTDINLKGNLEICAFKTAWELVLGRHDALRASFHSQEVPFPVQVIHKQLPLSFEVLDWSHMLPNEVEEKLQALLAADKEQGVDLNSAPLMRLKLIHLKQDEYH